MIRLELAAPAHQVIAIPVTAWVQTRLDVQPGQISVPTAGPLEKSLERTLVLTAPHGSELTITDLRSNLPQVQISCLANTATARSQTIMIIFPRGSRLTGPGPWWIEIVTNDPSLSSLRIPIVPPSGSSSPRERQP